MTCETWIMVYVLNIFFTTCKSGDRGDNREELWYIKSMEEFFAKFIAGFCKVQFLCYEGAPNWLGWGVLGIGVIILIWLYLVISG